MLVGVCLFTFIQIRVVIAFCLFILIFMQINKEREIEIVTYLNITKLTIAEYWWNDEWYQKIVFLVPTNKLQNSNKLS